MTLIIGLANVDQVILVADRRLSHLSAGRVLSEDSSKAGMLTCEDARLLFGFTGIASAGTFRTREWLLDAMLEAGPSDFTAVGILERLVERATRDFQSIPDLVRLPPAHRRLSIFLTGYVDWEKPPRIASSLISNFEDWTSATYRSEAADKFEIFSTREQRPYSGELTFIERVGMWPAMSATDERQLRSMLEQRKPRQAIIGKAVELIRGMADRPEAAGTIGKTLQSASVTPDRAAEVTVGYHPAGISEKVALCDAVILTRNAQLIAVDGELRLTQGGTIAVPRAGRNQPCPCGSGLKYKRCHGR